MITASLCLAMAVYYEARGEPIEGQAAVAQVILNRVADSGYPDTVCGVVTQPYQFSFLNHLKNVPVEQRVNIMVQKITDKGAWNRSKAIAKDVMMRRKPKISALYYHANIVTPEWSRSTKLVKLLTIGNHIFYGERG